MTETFHFATAVSEVLVLFKQSLHNTVSEDPMSMPFVYLLSIKHHCQNVTT